MKDTIKITWIIALLAVIGFSVAACSDDDDSGGSIFTYEGTVSNPDGIKATDFSYSYYGEQLSDYINEPASATISGSKLTIKLGVPKDEFLKEQEIGKYVTMTPSNAKVFLFNTLYTYDGEYYLSCMKDDSELGFIYVDRDVTIKGTEDMSTYDMSLKKGWNYVIPTIEKKDKYTFTSSTTMPSGFQWTVIRNAQRW